MKSRNRRNTFDFDLTKGHLNLLGIGDFDRRKRAAKRHRSLFMQN